MMALRVHETKGTTSRRILVGAALWARRLATLAKIKVARAGHRRLDQLADLSAFAQSEHFLVSDDDTEAVLKPVEVLPLYRGTRPAHLPNPFSLVFRSPAGSRPLPARS